MDSGFRVQCWRSGWRFQSHGHSQGALQGPVLKVRVEVSESWPFTRGAPGSSVERLRGIVFFQLPTVDHAYPPFRFASQGSGASRICEQPLVEGQGFSGLTARVCCGFTIQL